MKTHQKKARQGFTLLELLVVLVIIALVMSFGLPAYNNYVNRTKLTNVFQFVSSYRLNIQQHLFNYGDLSQANFEALGIEDDQPLFEKANIKDIQVESTASSVTLTVIPQGLSLGNESALVFTAQLEGANLNWQCQSIAIESDYLPTGCESQ